MLHKPESRNIVIRQTAHTWPIVAVKAPTSAAGLHGSTKNLSVHPPAPKSAAW